MNEELSISVVIPVYNSAGCLPELLRQLSDVLDQRGEPYEIILVDDASPDNSWDVLMRETAKRPKLSAVRLMRNGGQARATLCGLERARGGIVVTMDDDLQHRPDQLVILLSAMAAEPDLDCVFGVFDKKQHAGYRNLGSRIIHRINARAFGLPPGVRSSSFRVMRRELAKAASSHRTGNPALAAILCECTARLKSITIEHAPRYSGRSGYTLARQARLAWDNITNVSMWPLRATSVLGLATCGFSFVLVLVTLVRYFTHQIGVAGWTTVVILVAFFSGILLLALGVMGEYMVRVLREVRGAPRYIVRDLVVSPSPVAAADEREARRVGVQG